jgi:hypothetical protein
LRVPVLQVGNPDHVLLAHVAQRLDDVHGELLVEVEAGRGDWVVCRQDNLDRVVLLPVVLDHTLENDVIGSRLAREV